MCSADWCEVNDLDVGLQCLKQVQFFFRRKFWFYFRFCNLLDVAGGEFGSLRCYS